VPNLALTTLLKLSEPWYGTGHAEAAASAEAWSRSQCAQLGIHYDVRATWQSVLR
jgi:hypothetical protein